MLLAINCPLCTHSISKTTGTNYLLYETLNILAYTPHIYNNHFSLANHAKYDILIKYLQKHIWRRIEVVITGRTRNALALRGTRVRIPPSPLFKTETRFILYSCFFFLHFFSISHNFASKVPYFLQFMSTIFCQKIVK